MNVEANTALVKQAFDDDAAKVKLATDVATDCAAVTDGDRCEAAYKIIQCFDKGAKARGTDFADW